MLSPYSYKILHFITGKKIISYDWMFALNEVYVIAKYKC